MDGHIELRPIDADHLEPLVEVANAADVAWWGQGESDLDELSNYLEVLEAPSDSTREAWCGGALVGYVIVHGPSCELTAHPTPGGTDRDRVADRLLAWARSIGGVELDLPEQDEGLARVAAARGFRPAFASYELLRREPVPPAPDPTGIELTTIDRVDPAAVHRMLYRFWAETPTHHARGLDEWRTLFVEHPGADPAHKLVALDGTDVVGAGLGRIYTATTGWIAQLGVAPEVRGRGLGRALLDRTADQLAAVPGVVEVGLSVDASNDAALGLYRSAGFEVERVYRRWLAQPQTDRSSR